MISNLRQRLFYSFVFSVGFVIIGTLVPHLVYEIKSPESFYFVEQPLALDKQEYQPCDKMLISTIRTNNISLSGDFTRQLYMIEEGDGFRLVGDSVKRTERIVPRGENQKVTIEYNLPCNIPSGVYQWQILLEFEVKGSKKEYLMITESFRVTQNESDR